MKLLTIMLSNLILSTKLKSIQYEFFLNQKFSDMWQFYRRTQKIQESFSRVYYKEIYVI